MDCWGNLIKSSNVDGRKKKDRTRVVRDKLDRNENWMKYIEIIIWLFMCKFMIETCLLVLLFIAGRLLFTGYHDYTMNVWDTLKVRWLYYGNVYFIQWKLRYYRHWMIYLKRIKGKVQFLSITGWAAVSVLCPWQPHHLSRSIPRWDSSWHRKLGQHSESKLGVNFFRTSISRKLGWYVETTSREVFTGHVV